MNKFLILVCCIFIGTSALGQVMTDEFADSTLMDKNIEKPEVHLDYDYQGTARIPVGLRITERISSETKVYEGQEITFKVRSDIYYNGKLVFEKGTVIPAKIETIVKSGMNGIPASIIVGDFEFENIPKGQISDSFEIRGQDRSLWVYPLKWALTILPPTGTLTNFIKGGHAKLKENKTIQIYYYPEWI